MNTTNIARGANGHVKISSKWDEITAVDRETSEKLRLGLLPSSKNIDINILNSPGIVYPSVCSSSAVCQVKTVTTPSAEDIAVSEAIDAIEDLTSDFEAVTDESNTEEVPSELTPKVTKRKNTRVSKLKYAAEPSQKTQWPRTWLGNDSLCNDKSSPKTIEYGCKNSPASSLWTDSESWDTPSFLRYDAERPSRYRFVRPRETVRQRVTSLKHKVVEIARTDLGWVKEAMGNIRTKASPENPNHRVGSAENSRESSRDDSTYLSLRGGAGDISSLNGAGNDIFGIGGGTGDCCAQLSAELGSSVGFELSSIYANSQSSYWAKQQSELTPSCIIVPSTASEVAVAISIISTIESCNFAVKGAGHGTVVGATNINGGVKFDMSRLNEIETNSEGTVTRIGAGSQWGEVYEYLDNRGLSVAGGRNGDVGVAGVLLGGGISFYGPRVGWATDNILNVEVVLASGEITNANSTSNQDLLKALKGGNSNFGIATLFDLRTFPQGEMWVGYLGQSIDSRDEVFKAIADIASNANEDPFAALVGDFKFNSATKSWVMNHTVAYTKPVANPPIFQPLVNIKPQLSNNIAITNISTIATGQKNGANVAYNKNHLSYTGTYGNDAALLSKIFDISNATVHKIMSQTNGGIKWTTMMEPFPALVDSFGDKNGGNSLGLSAETGDRIVILQLAQFEDRDANDMVDKELHNMFEEIAKVASEMGLLRRFRYLNYADKQQNPIASYGPENVAQLKATSKKYDPKGLFQRQAPGGFKLGMQQ